MLKWRFDGSNNALLTSSGIRRAGRLEVDGEGCGLYGPYLDVPAGHLTARIILGQGAEGYARADITAAGGTILLAESDVRLTDVGGAIELSATLTEQASNLEVRLVGDIRADILGLELDLDRSPSDEIPQPDRPVGYESTKTYASKIESGFWSKYFSGAAVLELGYKGYYGTTVPIVPQAIGVDIGYPGYDGSTLPFDNDSFDAIYSSHCLEHIPDYAAVIRDWYRVLKIGGYLTIVVPHQHLFEKRSVMPSLSNYDHQRYYTSDSLLRELAEALPENSYRVRHLRENDEGFDYLLPPGISSGGSFEIELVVEKIRKPNWNSDDNTVRNYSAGEFLSDARRPNPWTIEIDFAQTDRCAVHGPYTPLRPADYIAEFHFAVLNVESLEGTSLTLDIARDGHRLEMVELSGHDGLEALRTNSVPIAFSVPSTGYYEFRIYRSGAMLPGTVRFRGVVLRYA